MKKIIFLFCFFVFSTFSFANSDSLLEKVQQRWNNLASFQANFEQVTKSYAETGILAKGVIRFQKPSFIRWEYQEPDEQLVIINQEKVWIYDPLLDTVNVKERKELLEENIFFYLSKENGLFRYFSLISELKCNESFQNSNFLKKKDQSLLCLKPKNKDSIIQKVALLVDNKNYLIQGFLIEEQEQSNEFFFHNLATNQNFEKKIFQFQPKAGTQIIK